MSREELERRVAELEAENHRLRQEDVPTTPPGFRSTCTVATQVKDGWTVRTVTVVQTNRPADFPENE